MNLGTLEEGEKIAPRYFIDLKWYEENNRSFLDLAQSRLCSACRDNLKAKQAKEKPHDPIIAIRDCCSKAKDYIAPNLPLMETIFRIFLANGNQPLSLEEISQQLLEQYGKASSVTTPEILHRLLEKDRYYGLRLAEPKVQ